MDQLRDKHNISEFKSAYTFYYPAFNVRSTDINAFIGLEQLKKLDVMCDKRYANLLLYDKLIKNDYWKIDFDREERIVNFAYPIIHPKRDEISKVLFENNIENRPLICGSMANQPFCKEYVNNKEDLKFAEIVDQFGMYVPNHPELSIEDIDKICEIINGVING